MTDIEPTMTVEFGDRLWRLNGQLHRAEGPTVERADGTREWYLNDQRHREDGPAIEWPDGTREWWINDQRHRIDGPVAVDRGSSTNICHLVNGLMQWLRHRKKEWR